MPVTDGARERRAILHCADCGDEIGVGSIDADEDRCAGVNAENDLIWFSSWEYAAEVELRCLDCAE